MSMLEKLAERVREQGGVDGYQDIPCCACDYFRTDKCRDAAHCPDYTDDNGALMLTRWAVKLVAEGLTQEREEAHLVMNNKLWELHKVVGYRHSNSGLKKADRDYRDACAALGRALIALITEASEKQAEEGSDGR